MQPTLAFIAVIFGASVMADSICNPGELALGVNQLCTTEDPGNVGCSPMDGEIFDSNCNNLATYTNSDLDNDQPYCSNPWTNGYSTVCDGNNYPDAIYDNQGNVYGYCYVPSNGDSACSSGFSYESYTSVAYCCGKEN